MASMAALEKKAVQAINKAGALLVFPLQNRKEPASIWSALYPRTKMRWEWDEDGDNRVAKLWMIRGNLSTTKDVIYAKWFQGRATYFSKEVFVWLLAFLRQSPKPMLREAHQILEILEQDSPLGPKQLREMTDTQGRRLEALYQRALKQLWQPLWIVGFGEIEDSSFPSLAVGSSRVIYEDLWNESLQITAEEAQKKLKTKLGEENLFYKYALKLKKARR
jgi:hypothetical protein